MPTRLPIGPENSELSWMNDAGHLAWLADQTRRQFEFFRPSVRADGGFDLLDWDGTPLPRDPQQLHTTTRLVHSYALGKAFGVTDADEIIDAGMDFLWTQHRDPAHGGYVWSTDGTGPADATKLAYGHVFVLLAASTAMQVGHPDAGRLLADSAQVIDTHFWDEDHGLLRDEFNRDWTPFSNYRGMNANMHGVEAMLAAFEATGESVWLTRSGRILDFFVGQIAPAHGWRIPEHYTEDWTIDADYGGNPMFRPKGTTPGHSFELGRLAVQHWDLSGRPDTAMVQNARNLVAQAFADAWAAKGGLAYTLDLNGEVAIPDRYWWPVTEAIGVVAALLKIQPDPINEDWYRKLWTFADAAFIDHDRGGWFPEIDAGGRPVSRQFPGKPDIYHSVQATLLPGIEGIARHIQRHA